jgi:cysteine-rich repeat protein
LDPAEECDDGNVIAGDGCAVDCVVECEPLDPDAPYEAVWKDPVTFHCYRRVGGGLGGNPFDPCLSTTSYSMVLADCLAWGGDAAALSTIEELDAVIASPLWETDEFHELIIGAEDVTGTGAWAWHNGEPWIYAPATPPWISIEPNGGTFLELYAYGADSGLNADVDFSACGYLCERPPAE